MEAQELRGPESDGRSSLSPLLDVMAPSAEVLDPSTVYSARDAPVAAVMCFFQDVIADRYDPTHAQMTSVWGGKPMRTTDTPRGPVAYFYPGLGAPAAATCMEEAIVMGCRSFVMVGGAGALRARLDLGAALIVERAIRDEGTSFHYAPTGRTIEPSADATDVLERTAVERGVPTERVTTWTTDAIHRETRARVQARSDEGASVVEMEAAALFAVAQHRQVRIACLLYAGDSLAGNQWDARSWTGASEIRSTLFDLAIDAASRATAAPGLIQGPEA